jgi:hypothetical protein
MKLFKKKKNLPFIQVHPFSKSSHKIIPNIQSIFLNQFPSNKFISTVTQMSKLPNKWPLSNPTSFLHNNLILTSDNLENLTPNHIAYKEIFFFAPLTNDNRLQRVLKIILHNRPGLPLLLKLYKLLRAYCR